MATSRAKKTNLNNTRKQVLSSVKSINCKVLNLADDIVDETLATGAKYQKVATNAIRKSEPIIEKQVDILFDTVELTIDQLRSNSKRFQKLLGITKQVKMAGEQLDKATATIGKIVTKVSGRVEEGMEDASKAVKKTVKRGKKVSAKGMKAVAKNTPVRASKKTKATSKRKATRTKRTGTKK